MEMFSKRVWKYTLILFLCEEVVEESTIQEHVQKAERLLETCHGRHFVMLLSEAETQIHGLLEEINFMVKENLDDFFLPPVYYEVIQSKIPQDIRDLETRYEDKFKMLRQEYCRRLTYKEQTDEPLLKRRRGSSENIRPNFSEDGNQAEDIVPIKSKDPDDILAIVKYYFKPISLLVLAVVGALIGSVVGSDFGVVGSGLGIVIGSIVAIPVSLCLIKSASMARQSSPPVEKKKD
ncbi:hypothetical protein Baya_4744 [Bagarius yarrelli]|uniref:AIG1-type G domain-containing protein n=1 Tax=Bagarius yarrelli TaxID=175774 RepID=A0A556TTL0_BAGYA|nr:hypothetical protein Baya_4744 [Bagarius yarrelli]